MLLNYVRKRKAAGPHGASSIGLSDVGLCTPLPAHNARELLKTTCRLLHVICHTLERVVKSA